MKQLTLEQAIAFDENKLYEKLTDKQLVDFQLFQVRLCMPMDVFKAAASRVLGRPVYTHELISDNFKKEYLGERAKPTLEEIINLIPADKRIILEV